MSLPHPPPRWWEPPLLANDEDTTQARTIHFIAWILLVAALPVVLHSLFRPPLARALAFMALQATLVVVLVAVRWGHVQAASRLLALSLPLIGTFSLNLAPRGSHSLVLVEFPLAVVVAGLVLPAVEFACVVVVCIAGAWSVIIAEIMRVKPGCLEPHADWLRPLDLLIVLGATVVIVDRLVAGLRGSLERARQKEAALLETRKALQEQARLLQESESNYRDVLDSVSDGMIIHDAASGLVVDVNHATLQMYGMTREEIVGTPLPAHDRGLPPYSAVEARRWLLRAVESGPQVVEWQACRKNGERFWAEVSLRCAEIGGQRRILALVRDMGAQREVEMALQRSHERYRSLVDSTHEAIGVLDAQGTIVYVNRQGADTVRSTPDLLCGRTLASLFGEPAVEGSLRELRSILDRGEGVSREQAFLVGSTERWFDVVATPVTYNATPAVLVLAADITERKEDQARAEQAEKMQALGQLASRVAHDFNNQLTTILGYGDLLAHRLGDAPLRRHAERIVRGASRSAELTRQLLAFARRGQPQVERVDMHEVIREVAALLGRSLDKRIAIRQQLEAAEAWVMGDPGQLQGALLNLALNARDAMPQGGVLAFATSIPTANEAGRLALPGGLEATRNLRVTVTDTGMGLSEQVRARIAAPMKGSPDTEATSDTGLAAVRAVVSRHRGGFHIESEPGRGSVVTLLLPLLETAAPEEEVAPVPVAAAGPLHLLVADDDEMVRDLTAMYLRTQGYRVTACADGSEVLEVFRAAPRDVDLIVLDLLMPGCGGLATLRTLVELDPSVRVLISSGIGLDSEAQECLDLGAIALVHKPYKVTDLGRAVVAALGRSREELAARRPVARHSS